MKRPIKLMQVVYSLHVGGVESLVVSLARKLNRKKYDVSVCALIEGGALKHSLEEIGVPVHVVHKRDGIDLDLPFRMSRLFKNTNSELIHTHNSAPWLYGSLAARLAKVRVHIHTEHSNLFSDQRKLIFMERFLTRMTDAVVSDSEIVKENMICVEKKKGNIRKIYNGVDINLYGRNENQREVRSEVGIKAGEKVVGIVARLEPVKDHFNLLEAFRIVLTRKPETVLLIVGDGSLREKIEQWILERGIEDRVRLLGNRNDVSRLMSIFDIAVLTSVSEGFPLTLLEAMAAGKPVVATSVGGNPEIVMQNQTGFLVPPENPEKFAEAINVLLEDEGLAHRMGKKGFTTVREKFSLEKMVANYEQLYDFWIQKKIGFRLPQYGLEYDS